MDLYDGGRILLATCIGGLNYMRDGILFLNIHHPNLKPEYGDV